MIENLSVFNDIPERSNNNIAVKLLHNILPCHDNEKFEMFWLYSWNILCYIWAEVFLTSFIHVENWVTLKVFYVVVQLRAYEWIQNVNDYLCMNARAEEADIYNSMGYLKGPVPFHQTKFILDKMLSL